MAHLKDGDGASLSQLYRQRFSPDELAYKRRLWEVLCRRFFQAFVRPSDTVLDLGAGTCEFINAIEAKEKIALDLNPEMENHLLEGRAICSSAAEMPLEDGSVDLVFSSNFFEHLPDKGTVLKVLGECRRVLRQGGRLITLQPNIRYLPGRYWDYFDHHTPLSDRSMAEALTLAGFEVERVIPRFLPYTVKGSRLPRSVALVRLYLRMPVAWPLLGKQMLIVVRSR